MSYEEFVDEVEEALQQTLDRLGYNVPVILETPPRPDMGDLATTAAFEISKQVKSNPVQIAAKIAENLVFSPDGMIDHVGVSGPYVNFFVKLEKLAHSTVEEISAMGLRYGMRGEKGPRVLIEHTNVNPNKAMHIGHARNSCLGDCLARILAHCGYQVQVANYVDDSGTQVADILLGFLELGIPQEPSTRMKFDQYCGDQVYVKVNKLYEADSTLIEKRKEISKKVEEGSNAIAELSKKITTRVLRAQLETCWRMGVYFDLINTESDILAMGLSGTAMARLRNIGIVTLENSGKLAGCWVVKATTMTQFADETDAVLIRSDGTTTYLGKDIAYAMWKLGLIDKDFNYGEFAIQPNGEKLWTTTTQKGELEHPAFGGVNRAISVIDVRQTRPQQIIKECIRLIVGAPSEKEYLHYGYEVVSLSPTTASAMGFTSHETEGKRLIHMEGRRGLFVNTDVVLSMLAEKATQEANKRNPDADESWAKTVGEQIAVAALRYSLTKVDNDKVIIFDLDDALNLEGETGPYIQYARVRAARIAEKAEKIVTNSADLSLLNNAEEAAILKELARFPFVTRTAGENVAPQKMCKYSYSLATLFNDYYEKHRILGREVDALTIARVRLVECVRIVLEISMSLLGMPVVDRM